MSENDAVAVQRRDTSRGEVETTPPASDPGSAAIEPQAIESSATRADGDPAGDCADPKTTTPPQSRREFEHALRTHLGFSKRQASAIAASGFAARGAGEDEATHDEPLAALLAALKPRRP